jgi:hypothetical protein
MYFQIDPSTRPPMYQSDYLHTMLPNIGDAIEVCSPNTRLMGTALYHGLTGMANGSNKWEQGLGKKRQYVGLTSLSTSQSTTLITLYFLKHFWWLDNLDVRASTLIQL